MENVLTNTQEIVAHYIAENILFSKKGYPYSMDASFLENGIIDSMNILELVMFVEEKLHVHVDDSEIIPDNFDSVSKIADYVQRKGKG